MPQGFDIYATTKIAVPNLVELLARVRDGRLQRPITVVHSEQSAEGEWVLATAAARLARSNLRIVGPESARALDLVEHAVRMSANVVFIGELRRLDDAKAARAAATLNIHPVAFLNAPSRGDADGALTMLGPWKSFDLALLSNRP